MQANNNQNPNQAQITFENEVPTLDPAVVSLSMGNRDNPPEEPLLLSLQDGFGYNVAAANGRTLSGFHLVRKLGWSNSCSVWLGIDTLAPTLTYAALKIMTKRASIDIHVSPLVPPDIEIYKRTSQLRLHPGFNHCATLQWHLATTSGLGRHVCYVTEVLSSSLANLRPRGQNRFTLPIAKRIIKQVLLALQCLHDKMWYTHTDVKAEKIFAAIPEPADSRIQEYREANPSAYTMYGPPLHLQSLPQPVVFSISEPLPYLGLGGSLEDITVKLSGFSRSMSISICERDDFVAAGNYAQPPTLRAPEVTLRYPWTNAIDIWTVGPLLFRLLTEESLFPQDEETYSHEVHLQRIVELLGPFPQEFLSKCADRDRYFDETGSLKHATAVFNPDSLQELLGRFGCVDEDEIPGVVAFMRKCLTLDPRLRQSARQLLEDDWLA
ncbi:hypothetical protein AGABI2DRAFT_121767 [Agaricus bisporus var. bisporus H97]|uniref:hypothetical protein n=1 Tax=Agaricus bisporus var. bisporus (strain H97 / ATCC MYA-4626 / FGSC 10389) TaxID=936046 RepID=UPI00029F5609|nr:hypothetical protein AGABI2DRAFT_121767 [Agaricus bisporus var. bisporus H97]EKV43624.1 hypothetical protein AGABI2DRAFT_121767 [Agaricus bisporus var. bisporus H97]